jgi:hypothetical protein
MKNIRNALWCLVAFGIVACAATPFSPHERVEFARLP